jgi:hypothetical protein
MQTLTITIGTENEAFDGYPELETARILHELAAGIASGKIDDDCNITDINGNTIGRLTIDVDGDE